MDELISVEIDDLTDEGLLCFLSTSLQERVTDLADWLVYGPLIERFNIDISYTPPSPRSARTILGWDDEPWTAARESSRGNLYRDGRSPQVAIAKLLILNSLSGEEIKAPYSQLKSMLKHPELHQND